MQLAAAYVAAENGRQERRLFGRDRRLIAVRYFGSRAIVAATTAAAFSLAGFKYVW